MDDVREGHLRQTGSPNPTVEWEIHGRHEEAMTALGVTNFQGDVRPRSRANDKAHDRHDADNIEPHLQSRRMRLFPCSDAPSRNSHSVKGAVRSLRETQPAGHRHCLVHFFRRVTADCAERIAAPLAMCASLETSTA